MRTRLAIKLLYCLFSNTSVFSFGPIFTKRKPLESLKNEAIAFHDSKELAALNGLSVAIAGAGPSGLLLAHRLLKEGAKCTIFESRGDPRIISSLEGGAYALGLGIRGRTAIKTVDDTLWQKIKEYGYECEKFDLHLSEQIKIRLRDATTRTIERYGDEEFTVEPSLLIYQSDLCSAFLDELNRLYGGSGLLNLNFNSTVRNVDFDRRKLQLGIDENEAGMQGPFDLVVGCDGVFSKVRKSMNSSFPFFQSAVGMLPGKFKVARLPMMPPRLDPTSVHLVRSRSSSSSAFLEPTENGKCCVLFATSGSSSSGKDSSSMGSSVIRTVGDLLMAVPEQSPKIDFESTAQDFLHQFPLLDGSNATDILLQLLSQRPRLVYTVKCNVYHVDSFAAIVGDAAHATGGVTGQGCNSALVDSAALADELHRCFTDESMVSLTKDQKIGKALLTYSQKQVPEGQALFDLAFGEATGNLWLKIWTLINSLVDSVFGGKFGIGRPPLQKLLTTSLIPFSTIRRDRRDLYTRIFPDAENFNISIASLM